MSEKSTKFNTYLGIREYWFTVKGLGEGIVAASSHQIEESSYSDSDSVFRVAYTSGSEGITINDYLESLEEAETCLKKQIAKDLLERRYALEQESKEIQLELDRLSQQGLDAFRSTRFGKIKKEKIKKEKR